MHDEDEKIVRLDEAAVKESGIEIATAGPGKLQVHDTLSGEIAFNSDRLAHIVPRVPGVVRKCARTWATRCGPATSWPCSKAGTWRTPRRPIWRGAQRLALAQANFSREESLRQEKITAEKDYSGEQAGPGGGPDCPAVRRAEAARPGLDREGSAKPFPLMPETSFTRYEITAPIDGTVVEKHIVLGEVFKEDSNPCFVIADLTSVWVDLKVHQQDLSHIRVRPDGRDQSGEDLQTEGTIAFVSNIVSETSRMAFARMTIANPEGAGDRACL